MIFPLFLMIADLMLWWLLADIVDRLGSLAYGNLLAVAVFGAALGVFIWVIVETVELAASGTKDRGDY